MATPIRTLTIFGTRPEAIKLAPVALALRDDTRFHSTVINTGQHRDLVAPITKLFDINHDYDLNVMSSNQSLSDIASKVISRLEVALKTVKPDVVLVQGDTTTVAASALASYYHKIPVAHVEAGLRSYDMYNPFPEEGNRKLVSQIASVHFAPTHTNKENLVKENIDPAAISVTGNTVIDALHIAISRSAMPSNSLLLNVINDSTRKILVTTHRRENLGKAMKNIGVALRELANRYEDATFIWPLHPNPEIRQTILPLVDSIPNILITNPLHYGEFTTVMSRCHLVLTDSGGIQEEAPALGIPVAVMRKATERTEGVESGTLRLVGTEVDSILRNVSAIMDSDAIYTEMSAATNPYGDGKAAKRILDSLASAL